MCYLRTPANLTHFIRFQKIVAITWRVIHCRSQSQQGKAHYLISVGQRKRHQQISVRGRGWRRGQSLNRFVGVGVKRTNSLLFDGNSVSRLIGLLPGVCLPNCSIFNAFLCERNLLHFAASLILLSDLINCTGIEGFRSGEC